MMERDMTKLDLNKPKYQPTRWTICVCCYGALDTLGDIVIIRDEGVRRMFHPMCFIRAKAQGHV